MFKININKFEFVNIKYLNPYKTIPKPHGYGVRSIALVQNKGQTENWVRPLTRSTLLISTSSAALLSPVAANRRRRRREIEPALPHIHSRAFEAHTKCKSIIFLCS